MDKQVASDSYARLQVAMRALGFPVKKEDVRKLMAEYDKEGSGRISMDSFFEISAFDFATQ